MNALIKVEWVEKLRSGEYEQGRNVLRTLDNKFCCLGVLCDLYQKTHTENAEWNEAEKCFVFKVGDQIEGAFPPKAVYEWAGFDVPDIDSAAGSYVISVRDDSGVRTSLVHLNDNNTPFSTIADVIEEQL